MPFVLKEYQKGCLAELAAYLRKVVEGGSADAAFYECAGRPYRPVKALPGLPYVCLRVPTGGGKTVMAAHAVGIAAERLLRTERCLVLWLAPTTQIVDQTRKALSDKRHPCRQALDDAFDGCVTVMDLSAALNLQRSTIDSDTTIIVTTLAAMRVENTEGRKIYEPNGRLMTHFTGLSELQLAELRKANGGESHIPSLANLLRLRRPLVIMDEAHNARTPLSFDTLARFNPSCILEFTATPDQDPKGDPSNVLTHVSAAQLKAEEMIKLPIRLKTCEQWREAIREALAKRDELESLATEEEGTSGEYLRPIILFQAQRRLQGEETVTFEKLKQSLIEDFGITPERIAIATGTINDIKDLDVLDRKIPVRFVITVDKLREGWDCPFAYVLCSVANLSSKTAVEQILGRILRLPNARRKNRDELNHAYAFVTSREFGQAAAALTDALVDIGFERFEAKTMVRPETPGILPLDFGLFAPQTLTEVLTVEPVLASLPQDLKKKVSIRTDEALIHLTYVGPPMTEAEKSALRSVVAPEEDKQAVERLYRRSRQEESWPAALGQKLAVPALAVRGADGQLELFEDQFLDSPWSLADFEAGLSESEFATSTGPRLVADVDVNKEGRIVQSQFIEELQQELALLDRGAPQNEADLIVWLDRGIEHPDVTQAEATLFIYRVVRYLTDKRDLTLPQVVSQRFRLRDAIATKIAGHRRTALSRAYQQMLLPNSDTPLEVSPERCFEFPLGQYPAQSLYQGPATFRKHYYEYPAHMNAEEAECAGMIDALPQIQYWVRNLERDQYSFWLQTSTDKFYPDFVAVLRDGRYLAVEYKGEMLLSTEDTREKKAIGDIWEARSDGRCVFRLVTKVDMWQAIQAAIAPR